MATIAVITWAPLPEAAGFLLGSVSGDLTVLSFLHFFFRNPRVYSCAAKERTSSFSMPVVPVISAMRSSSLSDEVVFGFGLVVGERTLCVCVRGRRHGGAAPSVT